MNAQVVSVSEPLTIKEIMEQEWVVDDPNAPTSGEELLLCDTVPWVPYDYHLPPLVLLRYDRKGEPIEWGVEDALNTLQSFYRKPIDWKRQRWVVLVLERVYGGEPKQTLRFSHKYPKLSYPVFTTIRKAGSKSSRFKVGDVVRVVFA